MYVQLALAAAIALTSFVSGWTVNGWRHDAEYAAQMEGGRFALEATAKELSRLDVTNTTIKQEVQTRVIKELVYRECEHDDDTFRLLNNAITGRDSASSTDTGKLPRTGTSFWKKFWGDNPEAGGSESAVP